MSGRSLRRPLLAASLLCCIRWAIPSCHVFTGSRNIFTPRSTPTACNRKLPERWRQQRTCNVATGADAGGFLHLDILEPAVQSYFASSPPLYPEMKDFLKENPITSHWAHAVGGTLLFAYGAYAIFLGWQIRLGNGGTVFPFSYGETAAKRHPGMMKIFLLFLFFEIPDGVTLLAANDERLLQSTHASTAVVSVALMSFIALLGFAGSSSRFARDAHALLAAVPSSCCYCTAILACILDGACKLPVSSMDPAAAADAPAALAMLLLLLPPPLLVVGAPAIAAVAGSRFFFFRCR
eukprot:CAMPEP_0172667896 /NCGR_PEP_ID=MMETSP1074-20121228/8721_1 /TAXON_ID=2916 /ORGANISM="Ceratium fusus, Strain PA161109" /LENGTH=293 /DNA_ID=CAMNT_0013484471 /DNA_START=47 /DNA_END=929 /DNA_ORIENTATION=+